MEIRLWKFVDDDSLINSFLEGKAVSHREEIKTADWFHWKFEQSPYGKAILACAFDGNRVAGCVAYGRGVVRYKGKEWSCALSYETFVHPDYQGQGLFKKLILLAEQEMKKDKIQFLYNFPNANSITGFKHMNWINRNDIRIFKIKICNMIRVVLNLSQIRQPFAPSPSNLSDIESISIDDLPLETPPADTIVPIWTKEYIKWRFFSYPNREYLVCNNKAFFSISMVGRRGNIRSVHILYAISKEGHSTDMIMGRIVREIRKLAHPDIIEYASTIMDSSLNRIFGFFKVPAHGNFCYKVLDDKMNIVDFKILLPSINAHTY